MRRPTTRQVRLTVLGAVTVIVGFFIDREGYLRYIDDAEKRFREELADQRRP